MTLGLPDWAITTIWFGKFSCKIWTYISKIVVYIVWYIGFVNFFICILVLQINFGCCLFFVRKDAVNFSPESFWVILIEIQSILNILRLCLCHKVFCSVSGLPGNFPGFVCIYQFCLHSNASFSIIICIMSSLIQSSFSWFIR